MSGEYKQRLTDLEVENAALRKQLENQPTLRDQFAMEAHPALIVRFQDWPIDQYAKYAYLHADAMLKARGNG